MNETWCESEFMVQTEFLDPDFGLQKRLNILQLTIFNRTRPTESNEFQ